MNNQKELLIESWHIRAHIFFILNGMKKMYKSKVHTIVSIIYWALVLFTRYVLLSDNSLLNNERRSFLMIFSALFYVIYLLKLGKPSGAGKMMRDSIRIGLTNHVGETPLLMERAIDESEVYTLVFRNFGIPLSKWNDHKEDIESGLNLNITDIEEHGKKYIILTAVSGENFLPEFVEWKDSYLSAENFALVLGETYTGRVKVNLAVTPHMLIGGSTGSGKSVLLKCLLMQCIKKNTEVIIADFKGGVDFPRVWHEKCTFITERNSLVEKLDELLIELHRRKVMLSDSDSPNIDEYNKKYHRHLHRIIFACDEVAELLDKTGLDKKQKEQISQIEASIASIARLGRAFGIHLILATQRPDANIISGQIKNNIDYRVCGRADDVLSQIILDKTDANDQISKNAQGRFLTNSDVLFQGYWFDDSGS